jgi:isopenicillin N synthase-like dioxygenase
VDTSYFEKCIEHGKKFFELPLEEKCKIHTDLIPDEFVGYHPLNSYQRDGRKLRGMHVSTLDVAVADGQQQRSQRSLQLGL